MAGRMLEAAPEDLELSEGRVYVKGAQNRGVSVADVTAAAQMRQWGTIMGQASCRATGTAPHFTCKFVEVSVDTETGHVSVDRVVAGADVGKVINPELVEGQLHGGAAQSFGYALMEQMQVDPETGRTLTTDFLNYKILTSRDAPTDFEVFFADTFEESGPFGAKGIGESATNDGASAVANAVANAIGVRITDLPITPEKVLQALKAI
jgi:CO/xanthine dehydrogenase Mo-binding subunit